MNNNSGGTPVPIIMDLKECASHLGITPRTLRRRIDEDGYPHFYVGKKLRFDLVEVIQYAKNYSPQRAPTSVPGILARPVKVRARRMIVSDNGPHTFHFGNKRTVRIPRMTYDIAHIDYIDNEVGEWVGLTLLLEAEFVEQESLQDYIV